MNDTSRRNRRRELISNPGAQYRIILIFGVIALLFACVNYYVSTTALNKTRQTLLELPLKGENRSDAAIVFQQQRQTLDQQLMLLTFLSIFGLLMAGVIVSHKLSGPLYQVTAYLRGVASGEQSPRRISFRRLDFFKELATAFNDFQVAKGILPSDAPPPDAAAAEPASES